METVQLIKATLIDEGYTGLYLPGECACEVDDLAPCDQCVQDDGEKYINGCEPGFKFSDPADPKNWLVKSANVAPTEDEWEILRSQHE